VQSPTKPEGPGLSAATEAAGFEPTQGAVVAEKYRIERVLGEGGMGRVVAATHLGLEQQVAIKFLHASAMRNPEVVERFQREAKVAAKVSSEHIARVTDVGTVNNVPYIVMEHLEGSDLGDLIEREGKLPIEEACEITLQACEALAEVHAAGIVHRDLKPSNLFITRRADGSPCLKLLDFGISKLTATSDDSGGDPALTQTTTIMGSPSYMSPEQLKSTKEVDARTDVWSLGAVLYEALTGKPAFRGETVPQVCAMIAADDPRRSFSPASIRSPTRAPACSILRGCSSATRRRARACRSSASRRCSASRRRRAGSGAQASSCPSCRWRARRRPRTSRARRPPGTGNSSRSSGAAKVPDRCSCWCCSRGACSPSACSPAASG
jgi:serine/threonine-protein kinase